MGKKKLIYAPPVARDLSCIQANGGLFTDDLEGGSSPTGLCLSGTAVTGAQCTTGTRVDGTGTCSPNGFDVGAQNFCGNGTGGSSGCISGTYVAV